MRTQKENSFSNEQLLEDLASSLEISDSIQEKAEARYESIGLWLNRDTSTLKKFSPKVHSQGSIRLGTAIKPLHEDDEYDLDAVCILENLNVDDLSQKKLKELVGIEVQGYVEANNFKKDLKEGKRCFTIEYSDAEQFHVDILPAVPDEKGFVSLLNEKGYSSYDEFNVSNAIAITDNTLLNYPLIVRNWNKSNPIGYSKWFAKQCNKSKIQKSFDSMAMESVETLPSFNEKKNLQKAIMILKSHRDNMYKNDGEDKPISIIITTLAGHSYDGSETLSETLRVIISNMENFIQYDGHKYIINNPVNPLENFADKWESEPNKITEFYRWLEKLKEDKDYLESDLTNTSLLEHKSYLQDSFGLDSINEIYEKNQIKPSVYKKIKDTLLSLTHIKRPTWGTSLLGTSSKIYITCQVSKSGRLTKSIASSEHIDKNLNLRFTVKLPRDFKKAHLKYYWQVANSGEEAHLADCLRGDIIEAEINSSTKGGKSWKEVSSYTGYHFVRCFILKNQECVGVSEPFIVNIK